MTVVHFAVFSRDVRRLQRLSRSIEARSPWPVRDIDRGGEFVTVTVRPGVTVLRLSETVARAGAPVQTRLQISGPSVLFSAADVLLIALLFCLVAAFGSTETRASDVFAYPRGMHPIAIVFQCVALGLFACFLITYVESGQRGVNAGMLVLDVAVALSFARWLWVLNAKRSDPALSGSARFAVAAAGTLAIFAGLFIAAGLY